ncbi:MAG: hypothetical protein EZS28_034864, partial [Streblomastix strix]
MLIFAILTAFAAINAENFSVNDEDGLRAAFVSIGGASSDPSHTITVDGTINLLAQINYLGLNDKDIVIRGISNAIITSSVSDTLFNLGGNNLALTLQDITLQDDGNYGLIQFQGSALIINSGTFTSGGTNSLIRTTDADVTIGATAAPVFIGVKILEIANTAPVGINPYRTVVITRGTFQLPAGSGSAGIQIVINNAAATFGINTTVSPTFTGLELLQVTGSTLNVAFSTIVATNLEVIDVRNANLVVNRGNLSGTATNGLQILISQTSAVTIGGQNTTNPTFANLDVITVDISQLNVLGGAFTARNPQATLITATNSDVNIGRVAAPTPTLTFSASKVLDVTGGTLNIYRGTLTGINPDTAIITTLETPVFIGGGPAAIFNGAKALDITNGSLNITNGTFTGQSNLDLAIITLRNVSAVIGSGFFPTFAGYNILDTYNGSLNLNGGVSRQIETYQTPGTIWTFNDTIVTIGLPLDQYASSTPMFQG